MNCAAIAGEPSVVGCELVNESIRNPFLKHNSGLHVPLTVAVGEAEHRWPNPYQTLWARESGGLFDPFVLPQEGWRKLNSALGDLMPVARDTDLS